MTDTERQDTSGAGSGDANEQTAQPERGSRGAGARGNVRTFSQTPDARPGPTGYMYRGVFYEFGVDELPADAAEVRHGKGARQPGQSHQGAGWPEVTRPGASGSGEAQKDNHVTRAGAPTRNPNAVGGGMGPRRPVGSNAPGAQRLGGAVVGDEEGSEESGGQQSAAGTRGRSGGRQFAHTREELEGMSKAELEAIADAKGIEVTRRDGDGKPLKDDYVDALAGQ